MIEMAVPVGALVDTSSPAIVLMIWSLIRICPPPLPHYWGIVWGIVLGMVLAMVGNKRPIIQGIAGDLGRLAQYNGSRGNIRGPGQLGLEHRTRLDQGLALIVEGDRIAGRISEGGSQGDLLSISQPVPFEIGVAILLGN